MIAETVFVWTFLDVVGLALTIIFGVIGLALWLFSKFELWAERRRQRKAEERARIDARCVEVEVSVPIVLVTEVKNNATKTVDDALEGSILLPWVDVPKHPRFAAWIAEQERERGPIDQARTVIVTRDKRHLLDL